MRRLLDRTRLVDGRCKQPISHFGDVLCYASTLRGISRPGLPSFKDGKPAGLSQVCEQIGTRDYSALTKMGSVLVTVTFTSCAPPGRLFDGLWEIKRYRHPELGKGVENEGAVNPKAPSRALRCVLPALPGTPALPASSTWPLVERPAKGKVPSSTFGRHPPWLRDLERDLEHSGGYVRSITRTERQPAGGMGSPLVGRDIVPQHRIGRGIWDPVPKMQRVWTARVVISPPPTSDAPNEILGSGEDLLLSAQLALGEMRPWPTLAMSTMSHKTPAGSKRSDLSMARYDRLSSANGVCE
ncbi:hypothetical protein CSOJ01_03060 [Colletotrichum sojae]|uniref:Uncharacterized protein n=1 Tax=Colletotrichum sojae TaxID=2175907 RepID=A0A8H6N1M6_9PEZI|nr:hypothetical protein CSOJ01_03060 [Colletotrichum sojae]